MAGESQANASLARYHACSHPSHPYLHFRDLRDGAHAPLPIISGAVHALPWKRLSGSFRHGECPASVKLSARQTVNRHRDWILACKRYPGYSTASMGRHLHAEDIVGWRARDPGIAINSSFPPVLSFSCSQQNFAVYQSRLVVESPR